MSAFDPLELIEQGCYLALRLGLRVSAGPADCLAGRAGVYCFSQDARRYSPLEAVLVGLEIRTGDWRDDAAEVLGVTAGWIQGFVDGFARTGERSSDQDYLQGFLTAEELLARRFRWLQGG